MTRRPNEVSVNKAYANEAWKYLHERDGIADDYEVIEPRDTRTDITVPNNAFNSASTHTSVMPHNLLQGLAPGRGSIEATTSRDRSIGIAIRVGVMALITLPVSIGIVWIALGQGDFITTVFLWGVMLLVAVLVLNEYDYRFSFGGIERKKVSSTETIALALIDREYKYRDRVLDYSHPEVAKEFRQEEQAYLSKPATKFLGRNRQ